MILVRNAPLERIEVVLSSSPNPRHTVLHVSNPLSACLQPERISIVNDVAAREPIQIQPARQPNRIFLRESVRLRIVIPIPIVAEISLVPLALQDGPVPVVPHAAAIAIERRPEVWPHNAPAVPGRVRR